jgi:hypothetical protein
MRSYLVTCLLLAIAIASAGCASTPGPAMSQARPADYGYQQMPSGSSFVERHPLLYEPLRQYQEAGPNPIMKVLVATASVPVGIVKEAGQIIQGR